MSSNNQASVADLFGNVVTELTTLVRKEVQLARAELGEKAGQVAGAAASLAIGGVLLLAALIILLQAAVVLLVRLGVPPGWAEVIVAAAVGLIGYLLLRGGLNRLKASNLVPTRTAEQLSRDAAVVKEQVR